MAATHSMGTVYIPLTEKEYRIMVTHKKILTVPTRLEGELQLGHPQYMEFYKSSRINKAVRTVATEVDTVQG